MIQTETTPNPDSLKFLSEKTLSAIGTEEFKREKVDIDFKPGLYNQVKDILLDVPKYSCSLDEHIKNWQIYEELFTKRIL